MWGDGRGSHVAEKGVAMRYRARVDANQPAITKALRDFGCSVQPIHTIGKGVPDLLVGKNGVNLLFELKDPTVPKWKQIMTDDEVTFMDSWRGQYNVVLTADDAIRLVKEYCKCLSYKNG